MDIVALAIPLLSFGAVAGAVVGGAMLFGGNKSIARRLDYYTGRGAAPARPDGQPPPEADVQLLKEQKYSNWAMLDQMIAKKSWADRENDELVRANLPLRIGEYMMLRWLVAGGAALVAFVLVGNLLAALPAAAIGYVAPRFYVKHCQGKRKAKFDDQLVEAIQLLGSTLKSGYSFLQGMEAVAREMPAPICEEFDRIVKEIGVGARVDDALQDLIDRVRSEDLELVVTAMVIQRQVGGELAGILETIAKTIRERQKIKRDVNTLTAQQRWSGYIIGAMPFALLGLISFLNPSYSNELLFTFHGQIMMVVALMMEGIGFVMIQKIIQIEV